MGVSYEMMFAKMKKKEGGEGNSIEKRDLN